MQPIVCMIMIMSLRRKQKLTITFNKDFDDVNKARVPLLDFYVKNVQHFLYYYKNYYFYYYHHYYYYY